MTVISLLLHGLILSAPLPLPKKAEPEPKKEKEEERISLTSLLPPSPIAAPKAAPTVPRSQAVPQAAVAQAPALATAPAPAPVAAPPATAPATAPPAAPSPAAPSPASLPAVDLGGNGSTGLCPNPRSFDAQQIGYFFSDPANPDSPPAAGIVKMDWKNTPPDKVQSDLQALAANQNLALQPIGSYGDAPLFALQTAQGQVALYASLVPGRGAASTLLVTWSADPNKLPAGTAALTRAQVCQ
ncbi:MAG TPA: hypothetical protein V6C57_13635 [Coleofasciculaceae cyanobacterium]